MNLFYKRSTVLNTPPAVVVSSSGADSHVSANVALILTLLLVLGAAAIALCFIARYVFLRRRGRLQIRRRGLSELTMRRLGIWIDKEVEVVLVRPRFHEVGLGGGGGEKAWRLDGTSSSKGGTKRDVESLPLSLTVSAPPPSQTKPAFIPFDLTFSPSSPLLLLSVLILPPTIAPSLYSVPSFTPSPSPVPPTSPRSPIPIDSSSSLDLQLELPEVQIGSLLVRIDPLPDQVHRREWEELLEGAREEERVWVNGEGRVVAHESR